MRTRAFALGLAAALTASCSGPDAPDDVLCRDVIHRLCLPNICTAVTVHFGVGANCETDLVARTGCDSGTFAFTTPSRDRVLECRLALVRAGTNIEKHPECLDVGDFIDLCPDVTTFFGGTP